MHQLTVWADTLEGWPLSKRIFNRRAATLCEQCSVGDMCPLMHSRLDVELLASALRSDAPDLEAEAAAAASPNPNLENQRAAQPAATVANMHRATGTFADPSHESAFAAQLFRMAYPTHVLLMALVLTYWTWKALVEPDMRGFWVVCGWALGLGLLCRVLLHRTGRHDPVRSQWKGSWAWIVLAALNIAADVGHLVVASAAACESVERAKYMAPFVYLSLALVNGSHGLGFACKFALVAIILIDCVVEIAICHIPELDPWLVCTMGVIVLGSATTHTAELFLRRSYAEKVQAKILELQLEERNEQLKAEKERLLYDMQRRGRPLDDNDDRNAIRRGLSCWRAPASRASSTGATRTRASPFPPHHTPSDSRPMLEVSGATRPTPCPRGPASEPPCGAGSSCGSNSEIGAILQASVPPEPYPRTGDTDPSEVGPPPCALEARAGADDPSQRGGPSV